MKFFVTHGLGLHPFVLRELEGKYSEEIRQLNITVEKSNSVGKIFFTVHRVTIGRATEESVDLDLFKRTCDILVRNLKSVERIFCHLFELFSDLSKCKNRQTVLKELFEFVRSEGDSVIQPLSLLADYVVFHDEKEEDDDERHGKRRKLEKSFRINAKVTGRFKKLVNSKEIASCVGSALIKNHLGKCGWGIDLRRPTLEISFYLTDEGVLCGAPLTSIPLSERSYLNKIPLRSTVAFSMASLAVEGETGELCRLAVLDPMCGSATILIELAKHISQTLFTVGIDLSEEQIAEAKANVTKSSEMDRVIIIKADSTKKLPFNQRLFFDAVVCDLPFGIQHGTEESVRAELPLVLANVNAVVKRNGNIVLLIGSKVGLFIEDFCSATLKWRLKDKYDVKLGELPAAIYHFKLL